MNLILYSGVKNLTDENFIFNLNLSNNSTIFLFQKNNIRLGGMQEEMVSISKYDYAKLENFKSN